jgi:hypothetical protein
MSLSRVSENGKFLLKMSNSFLTAEEYRELAGGDENAMRGTGNAGERWPTGTPDGHTRTCSR